jgi:ATP-binding cassette subfamily B protein
MAQKIKRWLRMASYLFRYTKRASVFITLCSVVAGIASPVTVWATQELTKALLQRSFASATLWVGAAIAIAYVMRFCNDTVADMQHWVIEAIWQHIDRQIASHIIQMDFVDATSPRMDELLTKIRKELGGAVARMYINTFMAIPAAIIVVGSALSIVILLPWWMTLVCLLTELPELYLQRKYGAAKYFRLRDSLPNRRRFLSVVEMMFSKEASEQIHLYNRGVRWLFEQFCRDGESFIVLYGSLVKRMIVWSVGSRLITIVVVTGGVSLYSLHLYMLGGLDLPQFFRVSASVTLLTVSMRAVVEKVTELGVAGTTLADVEEVLAIPLPESKESENASSLAIPSPESRGSENDSSVRGVRIQLVHVSYTYPGKTEPAVNDVSLTIEAGQHIVILGPNGSGKSTLLKIMTGLLKPQHGEVIINNRNIVDYSREEWEEMRAVICQSAYLVPATVRENLLYSRGNRPVDPQALEQALLASTAGEVIDQLGGMDVLLGDKLVGGLSPSGGEKMRLHIGSAFCHGGSVLFGDEAYAPLDPASRKEVVQAILNYWGTSVLVTHNMRHGRLADRILMMGEGDLIEAGTHEELLAKGGYYAELWALQEREGSID